MSSGRGLYGTDGLPAWLSRPTDPATSAAAAESMSAEHLSELQGLILASLRESEKTDEELIDAVAAKRSIADVRAGDADRSVQPSPSSVRTRRAELVRLGLVEDSGRSRRLSTGRLSIVWRASK